MSSEETVQQSQAGAVGNQLRTAREAKGLAIADIARAQHLRVSVIQAIEDGQYEQINSELFLKGYVRAYASQVGLDADAMISRLDSELEPMRQQQEQADQENPLITIEQRKRQKRRVARIVFFLLVVGVAGFIGYRVFLAGPGPMVNESAEPAPAVSEPESVEQAVEPVSDGDDAVSVDAADLPPADEGDDVIRVMPEPQVEEPVGPAPSEDQADDSGLDDVEPVAATVESAGSPVPAATDVQEPAAVSNEGRLEIVFSADCWMMVTDATGRKLVSSLRQAGTSLDVRGKPPLQVVIGAVDAIGSVRFQGESVDMSSYRVVNNRAEFTLGN